MTKPCKAFNAQGAPCGISFGIDNRGFCQIHGDPEYHKTISAKGGEATRQAWTAEGFTPDELPEMRTLADAKVALDTIRRAALTGKITHATANAATKAVAEWSKVESAKLTEILTQIQAAHDAQAAEIAELRKQLSTRRGIQVAR